MSDQENLGGSDPQDRPEDPSCIRELLFADHDPLGAAVHYATEGMADSTDLWWMYDTHRVMVPADAWILAGMWECEGHELEELNSPEFWSWWDEGPAEAKKHESLRK